MKKILAILLALTVWTGLCAASAETPKTELIVFAAASLTESLTEIKALYEKEHPETELVFNFDSSGTLKTQIQEGADCDVFISAGQKQMNSWISRRTRKRIRKGWILCWKEAGPTCWRTRWRWCSRRIRKRKSAALTRWRSF